MWLPTTANFHLANETSLLILQAWDELLSPQSPDSFQARVLDLPMLIEEIETVAHLAIESPIWAQYLGKLGAELQDVMSAEARFLDARPELKFVLKTLAAETQSSDATGKDQNGFRKHLYELALNCGAQFGDPVTVWLEDLKGLAAQMPREKENFLARLATIATQARRLRVEKSTLDAVLSDANSGVADLLALIDQLAVPLQATPRRFRCILAITGEQGDIESLFHGARFQQARRRHEIRGDMVSREFENRHESKQFLFYDIEATSYLRAAEQASSAVEISLNLVNLYQNTGDFNQATDVLVYRDERDHPKVVQLDAQEQMGLFPRTEARKLARESLTQIGPRLDGRLANALEHYSLALVATDPKIAMINFWTGLETLVGSDGPDNIGNRIAYWIAPIASLRRVDKIVTYLALALHDAHGKLERPIQDERLARSLTAWVDPQDVLEGLCGPDNNPQGSALFHLARDLPLMKFRLHHAWKEFHNPAEMRKSFDKSKTRVEWQLSRIYRARNMLIHRGQQTQLLPRLLQNMQYYLSIALSRVLHDLRDHPTWTTSTSLEHQLQKFAYVTNALSNGGKGLVAADLLPRELREPTKLIWPSPAAGGAAVQVTVAAPAPAPPAQATATPPASPPAALSAPLAPADGE